MDGGDRSILAIYKQHRHAISGFHPDDQTGFVSDERVSFAVDAGRVDFNYMR